jgi:hypothetical protein
MARIGSLSHLARDLGGRPNSAEKFARHEIFFGAHRKQRNFGFFGEISPKKISLPGSRWPRREMEGPARAKLDQRSRRHQLDPAKCVAAALSLALA